MGPVSDVSHAGSGHSGLGDGGCDVRHCLLKLRLQPGELSGHHRPQGPRHAGPLPIQPRAEGHRVRGVTVDGHMVHWSRSGQEPRVIPTDPVRSAGSSPSGAGPCPPYRTREEAGSPAVGMFRYGNWAQSISRPSGAHGIAAFADHPARKAPATATVAAPTGSTCSPTASRPPPEGTAPMGCEASRTGRSSPSS